MAGKPGIVNNPSGKGGFQERPNDIAKGRWSGETSISYNMNKLIRCSVDEFKKWMEAHPESERTMAQELAYTAVLNARKDLAYLKEVNDRTEGKAKQGIDLTSGGKRIMQQPAIISAITPRATDATTQGETETDS